MLSVRNLSKIYNKKGKKTVAIKNISLDFPDKGLVFVTGRSGSGKSTLLNQIGALDKPTSGEINFNGVRIDKLNEKLAGRYRNDCVGFVFQDFALVESMSVYDNVAIALEVKREKNFDGIDDILKQLDIYELKNNKVTELSAGQKQRVAIARAVVKNPKIILADEPTGNLDNEVGKLVLDFLKRISKTCLVIVISHNQEDAYKYADRIISISKGEIVSDIFSNQLERNKLKIGRTLYLNDVKTINEMEFRNINLNISAGQINSIRPIKDLFYQLGGTANSNKSSEKKPKFKNNSLAASKVNKLYKNFLFGNFKKSIFISMASMILIALFSLCVMLVNFDSAVIYSQSSLPTTTIKKGIRKNNGELDTQIAGRINEEDKKMFENCDDFYYTYNLECRALGYDHIFNGGAVSISYCFENIYTRYSFGTSVLTEEQFKKILDLDEISYVLKADEYKDYGIYITDYLADCCIFKSGGNYTDLIGASDSEYINGIIYTGYKVKFKDVFDKVAEQKTTATVNLKIDDDRKNEFCDFAHNYYAMAYSFNPNFINDYIEGSNCQGHPVKKSYLELDGYFSEEQLLPTYFSTKAYRDKYRINPDLGDNEVLVSSVFARSVLGNDLTIDELNDFFKDKKVKLVVTNGNDDVFYYDVTCVVIDSINMRWYGGANIQSALLNDCIYPCYINLLNKNSLDESKISQLDSHNLSIFGFGSEIGRQLESVISSYENLFKFIAIILFIASILFILYMNYDSVKRKKYDIGVLKAIGTPIKDLYKIYAINILLQFIVCMVFYAIFVVLFKYIANGILVDSLIKTISITAGYITFPIFNYTNLNFAIDSLTIIVSSLVGALFPIIKIKNIKPIDIVRCKY